MMPQYIPHFVGSVNAMPLYGPAVAAANAATPNDPYSTYMNTLAKLSAQDVYDRYQRAIGFPDDERERQMKLYDASLKAELMDRDYQGRIKLQQPELALKERMWQGDLTAQEERDRRLNQFDVDKQGRLIESQYQLEGMRNRHDMNRLLVEEDFKRQNFADLNANKLEMLDREMSAKQEQEWMDNVMRGVREGSLELPQKALERINSLDEAEFIVMDGDYNDEQKYAALKHIQEQRRTIYGQARPTRTPVEPIEQQIAKNVHTLPNGDWYQKDRHGNWSFHVRPEPKGPAAAKAKGSEAMTWVKDMVKVASGDALGGSFEDRLDGIMRTAAVLFPDDPSVASYMKLKAKKVGAETPKEAPPPKPGFFDNLFGRTPTSATSGVKTVPPEIGDVSMGAVPGPEVDWPTGRSGGVVAPPNAEQQALIKREHGVERMPYAPEVMNSRAVQAALAAANKGDVGAIRALERRGIPLNAKQQFPPSSSVPGVRQSTINAPPPVSPAAPPEVRPIPELRKREVFADAETNRDIALARMGDVEAQARLRHKGIPW